MVSPLELSIVIDNLVDNALKWADDNKARRRPQPRSSAMKPQCFEVIIEEEIAKQLNFIKFKVLSKKLIKKNL